MKIENVFSAFDGMSCGQIALNRLGIPYKKYFASEIDKPAIKVTQANYPNTIQLGDIRNISGYDLPKIDLFLCGSPCQGFSFAGKRLQFDDPRSQLFFEAVRIFNECKEKNPDIMFLFENVKMGLKNELVFTQYLGVEPILINSKSVSAQNRERLYWTNIRAVPHGLFGGMKTTIPQPKNKGLRIKDILEDNVDSKYYLSEKTTERIIKAVNFCNIHNEEDKSATLLASNGRQWNAMLCVRQLNPSKESNGQQPFQQNRIYDSEGLSHALTSQLSVGSNFIAYGGSQDERVFFENSVMGCLQSGRGDTKTKTLIGERLRRLTPVECERLQTVPDNYTSFVAETNRYKMLGNGWTIDVICHILSYL